MDDASYDTLTWAAVEAGMSKADVLAVALTLYVGALKADEVVLTTNGVPNRVVGLRKE
jgi:hypothetical protein